MTWYLLRDLGKKDDDCTFKILISLRKISGKF